MSVERTDCQLLLLVNVVFINSLRFIVESVNIVVLVVELKSIRQEK
jgi:uncharacterized protein (UPF0276 family)